MIDHQHHDQAGHQSEARRQLLDDAPPIRQNHARKIILVVSCAILFVVLTVVVMNIDRDLERHDHRAAIDDDVTELIAPRPLGELDEADSGFDMTRDLQPELARGGWVQIADPETGKLARQYRCKRLDPNPEGMPRGWLLLEEPQLEVYLSENRVVTLTGDEAIVYAPHNLLETGSVTGNVVVRLFEGENDRPVNVQRDNPVMRMTTEVANFENFMGEVHCPDWVRIESERLDVPGHDMRLLVNDRDNTIQLFISEFDYIRVTDVPQETSVAHRTASRRSARAESWRKVMHASTNAQPPTSHRMHVSAASSQSDSSTHATADDVPFYLLTITDDVRILQGDRQNRRAATGTQLEAVFSMQTRGMDSALTFNLPALEMPEHRSIQSTNGSQKQRHAGASTQPMPLHASIASLAFAQPGYVSDDEALLGPDVTLIRGSGPLTIVPLQDITRQPESPEDASIVLRGEPVHLCDLSRQSEASGTTFHYRTARDEIELIGDHRHPLRVDSPDLRAGGERFVLAQTEGRGAFTGPGWMAHHTTGHTHKPHCGGAVLATDTAAQHDTIREPLDTDDTDPELHITWDDGVELEFDTKNGDTDVEASGRLKRAVFTGSVKVLTNDFTLDADEMTVTFPADAEDSESIESIHAMGKVRVQGVSDDGSILCDDLTLTLKQTEDGRSVPTTMTATGHVQALDDEHIIWADTLNVWFMEPRASDGTDDAELRASSDSRWGDEVDIERVEADGDVQILLQDGTRAFADRLHGDGIRETVELFGDEVTIVSDNLIMDRGTHLVLNRQEGTAISPGPGRFRSFPRSISEPSRERHPRPTIDEARMPTDLRIAWSERMQYDSTDNEGAGSIDFRGDVDAESFPSPFERNTMTGGALTIEFEHAESDESGNQAFQDSERSTQRADQHDGRLLDRAEHRRQVRTMIARDDARLESQVWIEPGYEGDPERIFYVSGMHVEYDAITEHALVVGDGELLIYDATAPAEGRPAAQGAPFGARGTTLMRWSRKLEMERSIDDLYALTTDGDIELIHRSPDGERSTLTSERLFATIRRTESDAEHIEPGADGGVDAQPQRAGLDFSGSAELLRVRGEGGVVIRTDKREVDCDIFDYDVTTGMAILRAAPGRRIAIATTGAPGVMHAEQAVWNMERDSIRITRAAGEAPD